MLYKTKNGKLEVIAGTTVASGDTSPIGTTMLYDGKEVPTGWQEVEEVYSNPNMLINSDFRNPVNQRAQKKYISDKAVFYTIDRWRIGMNVTLNVEDGHITITNNDTVKRGFGQNLEFRLENNCIYTVSVKVKSVTGRCIVQEQSGLLGKELVAGLNVYTFNTKDYIDAGLLTERITINIESNASIELEYIKLEQGSIATPFVPRQYAEELGLCQRYYEIVEFLERAPYDAGKKWYMGERFMVTKRAIPTISSLNFYANSSTSLTNADFGTFQPTKESTGNINTKATYNYIKGILHYDAEIY